MSNTNHVGNIQQTAKHIKEAEANQLRAEIEAWQAAGGKIHVMKSGEKLERPDPEGLRPSAAHIVRPNNKFKKKAKD